MNAPKAHPPQAINPANAPATRVTEATRVPMSLPQLRLEVPAIPGYHTHWFLGKNVPRAIKAGYEFVSGEEAEVVNTGLANSREETGSTDMGSRISVFAGGTIEGTTEPERLYLMKLRQEWRDQDVKKLEEMNERIAAALRGGQTVPGASAPGETALDRSLRYIKKGQDLFYPKPRKKE